MEKAKTLTAVAIALLFASASGICAAASVVWTPPPAPGSMKLQELTIESTMWQVESAADVTRVVRVNPPNDGKQLVEAVAAPCLHFGVGWPYYSIVLGSHAALKSGNYVVIGEGHQFGKVRMASADEARRYQTCDWPDSLKQP